jgi:hypothetical protein
MEQVESKIGESGNWERFATNKPSGSMNVRVNEHREMVQRVEDNVYDAYATISQLEYIIL